jgi:hypothetical protein
MILLSGADVVSLPDVRWFMMSPFLHRERRECVLY